MEYIINLLSFITSSLNALNNSYLFLSKLMEPDSIIIISFLMIIFITIISTKIYGGTSKKVLEEMIEKYKSEILLDDIENAIKKDIEERKIIINEILQIIENKTVPKEEYIEEIQKIRETFVKQNELAEEIIKTINQNYKDIDIIKKIAKKIQKMLKILKKQKKIIQKYNKILDEIKKENEYFRKLTDILKDIVKKNKELHNNNDWGV